MLRHKATGALLPVIVKHQSPIFLNKKRFLIGICGPEGVLGPELTFLKPEHSRPIPSDGIKYVMDGFDVEAFNRATLGNDVDLPYTRYMWIGKKKKKKYFEKVKS
jgi:hypothetical protein